MKSVRAWAILCTSDNELDGARTWLDGEANGTTRTRLFPTRDDARKFCGECYGYIAERADLQAEPYGWKPSRVVRVKIEITIDESRGANFGSAAGG